MTHTDLEKLGWETIAVDTNSFVCKTTTINIWLEMFYCKEKDMVHLMLTKKGERLMQPDFGCDIWKVLFEQLDGSLIENTIETSILDAVGRWLPYINVEQIIFDYDNSDIDNNRITLEIKFSLASNRNIGSSLQVTVS